jgi:hypothetical protein
LAAGGSQAQPACSYTGIRENWTGKKF